VFRLQCQWINHITWPAVPEFRATSPSPWEITGCAHQLSPVRHPPPPTFLTT
jgi:hypothetical protein